MLDEIRIYKRSFDADEIEELYYSNLGKYDIDSWLLSVSQPGLTDGTYTYRSSATDDTPLMTEQRSAIVSLPDVLKKGPYLQNVTEDSVVIMWQTDTASDTHVTYDDDDAVADPVYVDITALVTIHEVQLTGLVPETTYYYNVTSGGLTSITGTFSTAPATPRSFRFAVYGDTEADPSAPDRHAAVAQGIIESEPILVLHTGDLVSDGATESLWGTEFFTPARNLMLNTPTYPILGDLDNNASWY